MAYEQGGATATGLVPMAEEDDPPAERNWLLQRLPRDVLNTLSIEQRNAIQNATSTSWRGHGVNIRMSLPFFGRRFYLTCVGGEERRPMQRVITEREHHPVRTMANSLFLAGVAFFFYAIVLVGLLVKAAVIEF
jgi:hypothetical protein